jgi:predicted nucleotidyltransferase
MSDILKVVVGSRLHGLSRPESDYDYRGVFTHDLAALVDPFTKPDETKWIEGATKDDTSYELRKFCRETASGNPNFIEMLFSNQIEFVSPEGQVMLDNRDKFIDSERVFQAYKGYAENQLNKMSLFAPDARTPKFAVAYIRSLLNGIELLRDGTITNPVPPLFDINGTKIAADRILRDVKFTPYTEFEEVRNLAQYTFTQLQVELARVFYASPRRQADKKWLTQFVREAYGVYS